MQIEITSLVETFAPDYSASCAEMGDNAGRITWGNNVRDAVPLLSTGEQKDAFRDFVKSSGGWTREEIAAWSDTELNALFHQWVMGDVREAPAILEGITFREESDGWYYESDETPDMETGPFDSRSDAYRDACPGSGYPSADTLAEIDWPEYEAMATRGTISSRLWKDDSGSYWFDLSE